MALIAANLQDVLEFSASMPRSGAWTADLLVDDPDALSGAVRVVIDTNEQTLGIAAGLVLNGTAIRSGVFVDTGHVRIVAGAGGLGLSAIPKHYNGVSVGVILGDLLAAAGETLSSTADRNILSTGLDSWTTTAIPVGTLISLLLAAAAPGASWRMLPDGTLWIGMETWPDLGIDSSTYQIFEDSAEQNSMLIGVDAPFLLPGTMFEGRKVSRTDHVVQMNGGVVETRVWFEDAAPTTTDRLKGAIARLVRAVLPGIDYRARYFATVIQQGGSTIDVQLQQVEGGDPLPDMAGVPLLLGIPGAVNNIVGGRVLIGWAGADPSQPYAEAFDVDASLPGGAHPGSLVIAGGTAGVARVGDAVRLTLSPADIAAIAASMIAGGLVPPGAGGSAPVPVPVTGENVIAAGSSIVKVG